MVKYLIWCWFISFFLVLQMVAFQVFGFSVYWYWIFYALAFLVGYFWLAFLGKKQRFSKNPTLHYFLTEGLESLMITLVLWVMVWGRLGHVLIYGEGYYRQHLIKIFAVWEWGMSFIGGIIGVLLGVLLLIRKKKWGKKEFFLLFDILLLFVPLGILLGRLGNFLNQELYGIPIMQLSAALSSLFTTLNLTHIYPLVDPLVRVNTNFLSMIFEGGLLLFGVWLLFFSQYKKNQRNVWSISVFFLFFYSLIRFFLEYLRADSQLEFIWVFTKSQWFFLVFMVISLGITYFLYKKKKEFSLTLCK